MIYTESKKVEQHKETIQTVMEFCEYLQSTGTMVNETDVFDWLKIDLDKYHKELMDMEIKSHNALNQNVLQLYAVALVER